MNLPKDCHWLLIYSSNYGVEYSESISKARPPEYKTELFGYIATVGVRLSQFAPCWPLFGLLYQPQMFHDDECEAVGVMRINRGNPSTRRKPVPVSLCSPQIPHDLSWVWTLAAAGGSRRLIFFYLVCEAIGTAATPGLLWQPRVILKMIVEKQMECRLARETEVLGENLP
jgi:hypothetical protein